MRANIAGVESIVGIVVTLAIIAVTVWLFRRYMDTRISVRDAQSWPAAEATVTQWHPQQLAMLYPSGRSSHADMWQWSAVLEYLFEAEGEFFSGAFCLAQWVESADQCKLLASPWLKRKIRIRYKPDDPAKSIFLESDGAPPGALPPEMQSTQYRGAPITLSSK